MIEIKAALHRGADGSRHLRYARHKPLAQVVVDGAKRSRHLHLIGNYVEGGPAVNSTNGEDCAIKGALLAAHQGLEGGDDVRRDDHRVHGQMR